MNAEKLSDMSATNQSIAESGGILDSTPRMITGSQIRAGRALIRWSVAKLAQESGIGEATIHRAQAGDNVPGIRADYLNAIQRALESGGCLFLDESDIRTGGVGVRLRARRSQ